MIRAQLLIRLPEGLWLTDVSQTFPDATFSLLAGYSAGETAIELGEIHADEPDAHVDALRTHPAITQFELLESADGRALTKYETTDTDLYEFVELSSLPVEFPVVARNGWFEFDLTGTREELEQLRTTLEESAVAFELQSVVSTTDSGTLLTDRQRELLEAAVREGYFEVPRECTLAELAETLGIDKATASTTLRRGEAALIKWFLTGPERKGIRGR
ncbi:helix-turn-helix domain-containing protein [Natronorubrum texcoconense]|uniref:HTH DNA binding domain-containing protein n=1 Tax=Natronorubrum texcoconense TaxID=1095776 RepID=A0A1G8Y2H3_9EURY|nr:helix-turn-helix domain-containing protein [Natronorubrum texcoconense]SDJ96986.1 HTH DNA binding domain-containing protein [Natronorubrum texcoconense]